MDQITDQKKHDYLIEWLWECEDHEAGFKVYSHNRFPNKKYKLGRAYEVMKEHEPSVDPIITVQLNDDEGIEKLRKALLPITNPREHAIQGLAKAIGVNPDGLREAFDKPI